MRSKSCLFRLLVDCLVWCGTTINSAKSPLLLYVISVGHDEEHPVIFADLKFISQVEMSSFPRYSPSKAIKVENSTFHRFCKEASRLNALDHSNGCNSVNVQTFRDWKHFLMDHPVQGTVYQSASIYVLMKYRRERCFLNMLFSNIYSFSLCHYSTPFHSI